MLQITPEAGVAIAELTREEGVAADGGLRLMRLAPRHVSERGGVALEVAALSEDADVTVVESDTGARVFLDPLAAEFAEDKTLDVDEQVDGEATFSIETRNAA
jgi:iron-sulfur cluster assembly protein